MLLIIFYLIGIILTFAFYATFGKKIGFDYSKPKSYVDHDDWDSNSAAYTSFSIFWPITVPILLIVGIIYGLHWLGKQFVKD